MSINEDIKCRVRSAVESTVTKGAIYLIVGVGIPSLVAVSAWGLNAIISIQRDMATIPALVLDVRELEQWRTSQAQDFLANPRFSSRDATQLESKIMSAVQRGDDMAMRRIERLEDRVQ